MSEKAALLKHLDATHEAVLIFGHEIANPDVDSAAHLHAWSAGGPLEVLVAGDADNAPWEGPHVVGVVLHRVSGLDQAHAQGFDLEALRSLRGQAQTTLASQAEALDAVAEDAGAELKPPALYLGATGQLCGARLAYGQWDDTDPDEVETPLELGPVRWWHGRRGGTSEASVGRVRGIALEHLSFDDDRLLCLIHLEDLAVRLKAAREEHGVSGRIHLFNWYD